MTSSTNTAAHLAASSSRVLLLTGAGLSTASGIPDFRGPQGVWTKNPEAAALSDFNSYVTRSDIRTMSWQRLLETKDHRPQPNAAHRAIVDFETTGRSIGVVTQNTDGLHVKVGSDQTRLIEIHGHNRQTRCLWCGTLYDTEAVLERVRQGDVDPHCELVEEGSSICGGILKTLVVSFGQPLVPTELRAAEQWASECDLLICVGSTLSVWPVAGLVVTAVSNGAELIIVNADPTPFDSVASATVRGDIATVLPEII